MLSEEPVSHKRKIGGILIKSFLVLLLIAGLAAFLYVKFYLTPFVKNKIITGVHQSSEGLYTLHMGEFNLNFWNGGVRMEHLKLTQDTTVLRILREEDPTSYLSTVKVDIGLITVSRIWWLNYLFNKDVEVGKVVIWDPVLSIDGRVPHDTLKLSKQSFLEVLPGLIAAFAGSLQIEKLSVNNGKMHHNLIGDNGTTRQDADSIFIIMKEIRIDTVAPRKALYTDYVTFHMQNYQLLTADDLYRFNVNKMWGSYGDSTLAMEGINLTPLKKASLTQDFYQLSVYRIETSAIDFPLFFRDHKVMLGKLELLRPQFKMNMNTGQDKKPDRSSRNILTTLLPYIGNAFYLKELSISKGKLNSQVRKPKGLYTYDAGNINVSVKDVRVDTNTVNTLKYWNSIQGDVSVFTAMMAPYNLKVEIGHLSSTGKSDVHLSNITLGRIKQPKEENLFYNNWIKKVSVSNFDFYALFFEGDFLMDALDAKDVHLEFTQDEKIKDNDNGGIPRMPHEIFKGLNFNVHVGKIAMVNTDIIYLNIDPAIYTDGRLTFERCNIEINNFSTLKSPATLKAEMYVMGQGLLKLNMIIPLNAANMDFTYEGSLSPMDATAFNSLFAYDELKLKSGTIEASWFKVNVVNGIATGEVQLLYKDLKVRVIEKEEGKVKRFLSRIGNLFLKDDNQPENGEAPEVSKINYARKSDDTFFYYLWATLSESLSETVVKDFFEPVVKHLEKRK